MDHQLKRIVAGGDKYIRIADLAAGVLEVVPADAEAATPVTHPMRPLAELYGAGTGRLSIDTADETFHPLLLSIEETFVVRARVDPWLTDGAVLTALDRLCLSPEADVRTDAVAAALQLELRLALSLNDYSRQDVRLALRKVKQSVARHTRESGPRGYLTFIVAQLGR